MIRVLAERGPLMVKEIAQALPGMDPSKLTRLLDSLEKQGYARRTLNQANRRSFLVALIERGLKLLGEFTYHLLELGEVMLATLTPTERLVLVELFTKIQANWNASARSQEPLTSEAHSRFDREMCHGRRSGLCQIGRCRFKTA